MFRLSSMTINRSGTVNFAVKGDHHCGPQTSVVKGRLTAKWNFVVECAPSLDAHGFLFDQATLGNFVERVTKHEPYESCEHMSRDLAIKFLAHLARTVPTCFVERLTVTISPDPYAASLSVTYVRDDETLHLPQE